MVNQHLKSQLQYFKSGRFFKMYLLSVFAPLIGGLVNVSPLARSIGHRGASIVAIACMVLAFISSVIVYYEVVFMGCSVSIDVAGTWFSVGSFGAGWTFNFDILTANMLFTVTGVSMAVHMYACDYMRQDPHLNLFLGYLSFFTGFMCVLVAADNLLVMLVGWEGIGVCSYLLIGYWSHRLSAVKSAQKAILVNRVSDGLLLWGVLWVWYHLGSLEYDLISVYSASGFIGLSILIGAMGKSAQILFHVWLADAMEGPTPVSALIHAATLVTAGVYLLVRLHIHDEQFVIIVGCLTAFMAGVFGATQNDLKRVIAYSTCSQLGYSPSISAIKYIPFISLLLYLLSDVNIDSCQSQALFFCRNISSNKSDLQINKNDRLPDSYVDRFANLDTVMLRTIKQKYAKVPVIYLWYNKLSGKTYVGRTVNLKRRLENYLALSYLQRTKNSMPICAALLKYGVLNFELYVLENLSPDSNNYHLREDSWVSQVNPSYNIAAVVDCFVGQNHPRFGKVVSTEIRNKISTILTGRKLTLIHRDNISLAHKKKQVFCYDYTTGKHIVTFPGVRAMCRELNLASHVQIQRKLDNNKPFVCNYNSVKQTWSLSTVQKIQN